VLGPAEVTVHGAAARPERARLLARDGPLPVPGFQPRRHPTVV